MCHAPMDKVIRKFQLGDPTPDREDRAYWLSRPPTERFAEVDRLRRLKYGAMGPIERVIERMEAPWVKAAAPSEADQEEAASERET